MSSNLEIGIRKNVEFDRVQYWLMINAKNINENEQDTISIKENFLQKKAFNFSLNFIDGMRWSIFIIILILINFLISINYIFHETEKSFMVVIIIAHFTCVVYMIDFAAAVIIKIAAKKQKRRMKTRKIFYLILDALSLVPLSATYMIVEKDPRTTTFWLLRSITILRFYRIPLFITEIATPGRKFWTIFIIACVLYLFISVDIFANIFYVYYDYPIRIQDWNSTSTNRFIVFFYFSTASLFNVGFGDIVLEKPWERIVMSLAIFLGNTIIFGVITGTMAIELASRDKKREIFRHDYEATKRNLKALNLEKKLLEKISDNMQALWKFKGGHMETAASQLLPMALQKEIYFDIHFGLLNRSLIFSKQPRAFLRSVVVHMRNLSYLPGDIITEASGMAEGMMCIISGVIEILSEENDETPLISFTNGTILCEAALFVSVPNRCIIRAATYVELQVLMKVHFAKVGIRYPDTYRAMQAQVYRRLQFKTEPDKGFKFLESDFYDLSSKKAIKRLIQELRKQRKGDTKSQFSSIQNSEILKLYVWSENIPRMKILPINLVQGKPWILRPDSFFIKVWEAWMMVIINFVVYGYPYLAIFENSFSPLGLFFLVVTDIFYVGDLIVQCITAVERKDNFTYITSIREIIQHKLTTVTFYFDVLSTYNFNIYSAIANPENPEYAYLLLSMNRLLKWWRVVQYFNKLENNLNVNFQLIVTLKYIYYFTILVWWLSALLYFEACPGSQCVANRWYAQLQIREEMELINEHVTDWPPLVSLYWATIIIYGVGYGDIYATAVLDCVVVVIAIIVGAILFCFTEAHASSSMRHLFRSRTDYQEEIFAVERFMEEHDLPKVIKLKVKNYFRLQWNYDQGFILQQVNVTDGFIGLQKSIILNQVMRKFLAVPIFRGVGDDFLRILTKSSKLCILPPDEMITETGSFVRETYILESGYCQVSTSNAENEERIIGPVNSFGFIEMILGTPMEINVRTITHARIIYLDYFAYLKAVTKYPAVKKQIDDTFNKKYKANSRKKWDNLGFGPLEESEAQKISKSHKEFLTEPILNIYKYHKNTKTEYWKPFHKWGKFRLFQIFLLPIVLTPNSFLLKIWMALRMINVMTIGVIVPVHYSLPEDTEYLHALIIITLLFTYIDIYLMFHVAFYNEQGLLIYHPAKTAVHYLKGNFTLDLITSIPFHLFLDRPSATSIYTFFYNVPNLLIVLQFYKIWQACYYLERDIMKKSDYIKVLKFIPLTLVVTNIIAGLLIIVECSNGYTIEDTAEALEGDLTLRDQFILGLVKYCPDVPGNYSLPDGGLTAFKFYAIAFYWVTYTMTQIGFGDVYDHNNRALVCVIIIILLGVFLYAYMFASITGAMLSLHVEITNYRNMILKMVNFMKINKIPERKQKQMVLHYEYTWLRTEGTKPQKMFTRVHTALRENILTKMYEATIRQVPAFASIDMALIRLIGRHLNEIYFLLGETIVDYHDKLEYIYLIYRGKVDVLSEGGEFITSLGSGGLFGNISNKTFCLSSETMIAAKNVDILSVDAEIFFKALQVFPQAKSLLDYLYSQKSDYIEPLARSERAEFEGRLLDADTIPYELVGLKVIRPDVNFASVDSVRKKKYFHLRGSVYANPKHKISSAVIFPPSVLYKTIDIITVLAAYWTFVITLYMLAFQDLSIILLVLSYIMDIYFIIRFILEFHFSYFDKYGDLVVNKKLIRRRYFKSKLRVFNDVIALLPLDIGIAGMPLNWRWQMLTILRLNKLLRIRYILEFYKSKFKELMVNKVWLQLSYVVIIITLMVHILSCVWFFVISPLGDTQPQTWLTKMNLENEEKWKLYTIASYFISTLCTTTGFGDIPVFSTPELLVTIVFTIFSHFALAWIAGTMASIASAQGNSLFTYQERITDLKKSFIRQHISVHQLTKFWHYVTALWYRDYGKQIPDFVVVAPYAMKCNIMYDMFGTHLSQAYPFSQTEEAFLRQLASYFKRNVFFPGNYIVQQGDTDRTMYFIHKGDVLVLTIRADLMETIHFKLTENDHFGMSQGLILEKPHSFSYRAETEVEILSLNLSQWDHLFRYFPQAKEKIYDRIFNILPAVNENPKLFKV